MKLQTMIKNACCSQIEYYQLEGIDLDATGNTLSGQSASIGDLATLAATSQLADKQIVLLLVVFRTLRELDF